MRRSCSASTSSRGPPRWLVPRRSSAAPSCQSGTSQRQAPGSGALGFMAKVNGRRVVGAKGIVIGRAKLPARDVAEARSRALGFSLGC